MIEYVHSFAFDCNIPTMEMNEFKTAKHLRCNIQY